MNIELPTYPFHEISECFPLMTGAEFEAFKENINKVGQREPVWLYQGRIIDGRNRYNACKALGRPVETLEWDGNGTLAEFVESLNLHRRHLSESQRAVAAAKLKKRFEEEARERMVSGKKSDPSANMREGEATLASIDARVPTSAKGKSSEAAAKQMNVSPKAVERASAVLRDGVPDLVKAVQSGEVAVSAAVEVSRLPESVQQSIVDSGPTAIIQHASKARAERVEAKRVGGQRPATSEESEGEAADLLMKFNRTTINLSTYFNGLDADQIRALSELFQPADRKEAVRELKELAKTLNRWIAILETRHA